MRFIELKVPPLGVLIIAAILMWFTKEDIPQNFIPEQINLFIAFIFLTAGIAGIVFSKIQFSKMSTTINPFNPGNTTKLITSGIFSYTRNPIYLCMVFLLIAWGLYLETTINLIYVAIFAVYINRFQIIPEERELEKTFKEDFLVYKKRVRRWV